MQSREHPEQQKGLNNEVHHHLHGKKKERKETRIWLERQAKVF